MKLQFFAEVLSNNYFNHPLVWKINNPCQFHGIDSGTWCDQRVTCFSRLWTEFGRPLCEIAMSKRFDIERNEAYQWIPKEILYHSNKVSFHYFCERYDLLKYGNHTLRQGSDRFGNSLSAH
jgi:hypothetical protein